MLAFNFFFLPPLYTLTLTDSRNWFALVAFVVTAVVVSELAAGQRRRARESALLAEIATSLLERGQVGTELERIAAQAARALQVESATITLDGSTSAPVGAERYPLTAGERRVGWIDLERPRPEAPRRDAVSCPRSARSSGSPSTVIGCSARPSRRRPCAGATR